MMERVEWTRRTADEIEALLSMLICLDGHPNAVRIRPSKGDGGIDVIEKHPDGSATVWQIKSFANNLGSSQKLQIAGSWDRIQSYAKEQGFEIREWHLVMPLDPTNENLKWLDELPNPKAVPRYWKGLNAVEPMVSKNPTLVDYYLHGGKGRLDSAITDLVTIAKSETGTTTVDYLTEKLKAARKVLDTIDPFYQYGIASYPTGHYPPLTPAPMLVGTIVQDDGTETTVISIYARAKESLTERPIEFAFSLPNTPAALDFLDYGIPLTNHAVSGILINLPAALGPDVAEGSITTGISGPELGNERLKLSVVDKGGRPVEAIELTRTSAARGSIGSHWIGVDETGVFTLRAKVWPAAAIDFELLSTGGKIVGASPTAVMRIITFVENAQPPNSIAIGPINTQVVSDQFPFGPNFPDPVVDPQLRRIIAALATVEAYAPVEIRIPDLAAIPVTEINGWLRAAIVLGGGTVSFIRLAVVESVSPAGEIPDTLDNLDVEIPISIAWKGSTIQLAKGRARAARINVEKVEQTDDRSKLIFTPVGEPGTVSLM